MDLTCFENKVTSDFTLFEKKWRFDDAFLGLRKSNRLEVKPTPDAEDREDSFFHKKRESIEVDLTRSEKKTPHMILGIDIFSFTELGNGVKTSM